MLPECKDAIARVRTEIENSRGTRIWDDYVNALRLVSQVVFTRSSGFVLELIQNAEDSGLRLKTPGQFIITLNRDRVKVVHNGAPFDELDLKALCGIRSSKKPESGTLGYQGIGFKSVFKVTDRPEVYSGGFHFKFDRGCWPDPARTPWYVLPIPIDEPTTEIEPQKTTFIIPFKESGLYDALVPELDRLSTELYLFLRWLRHIEVVDEGRGRSWTLVNKGEDSNGVTTLARGEAIQRFKIFRRECEVPAAVRTDRLTQEYRPDVTKREVAIALSLAEDGRLAPQSATAMYGGVYSFIPLGEAASGAKFPIQADFLVQPGREAANYEAPWNHWLLQEVVSLCKEDVIQVLKSHPEWRYQVLEVFEFRSSPGLEAYDRFFQQRLHVPLEDYLRVDECVPTASGGWASPSQVVVVEETEGALRDLEDSGLLAGDEIAEAMAARTGVKLAHPRVVGPRLTRVSRLGLLENSTLLEMKAGEPDAAEWFRSLYLWLSQHPRYTWSKRNNRYPEGYHNYNFVLSAARVLERGGDVWLIDLPDSDPFLVGLADTWREDEATLHPDILGGASEEERRTLRGFFTGLTGVQILNLKQAVEVEILPRILTTASKPQDGDLLRFTGYCRSAIGSEVKRGTEIWVVTKSGPIMRASEVLLASELLPRRNWESRRQYVPGTNFLSPSYLGNSRSPEDISRWREFFRAAGVKEDPDNGVEVFAENFAKEKLQPQFPGLYSVNKLNHGYDLETMLPTGGKTCIEVKGLTQDADRDLTGNEADAARSHGANYYLCIVSGIPENPSLYLVPNPVTLDKGEKITITVDTWKNYQVL